VADLSQLRRDRRRQEMRDEIARAALELFEARSFDEVSVDEIAAAVEVSQRTFFRYFDSKQDVLFADHEERISELQELLEGRPASERVLDTIRAALAESVAIYDGAAAKEIFRRMAVVGSSPTLTAYSMALQADWEAVISRHVSRRLPDGAGRDLRAAVISGASMAAMRVAIAQWRASNGKRSYADLLGATFDVLDGGLNPTPRRASRPR
jgi:AcrR family transcriptional regulator